MEKLRVNLNPLTSVPRAAKPFDAVAGTSEILTSPDRPSSQVEH